MYFRITELAEIKIGWCQLATCNAGNCLQYPVYNVKNARQGGKKTGVNSLLTEARSGKSDQKERLEDLIKSLQENSPKLYGTKVLDTTSIDALPVVKTCFGQCLVGSFGSYQFSVT